MADNRIIPKPLFEERRGGSFIITAETEICAGGFSVEKIRKTPALTLPGSTRGGEKGAEVITPAERAGQLVEMLAPAMGVRLRVVAEGAGANCVVLKIDPELSKLGDEGYRLEVDPRRVSLRAASHVGLFYGLQTLRQLLPVQIFSGSAVRGIEWEIPCGIIEDRPRFGWRGMMLDCARHFMPIEFIFELIDLLALHKLNIFHWHLTDDQGWRIEIKKYPKLTEIGGWRRETLIGHALSKEEHLFDGKPHGGFYTQEQIRDVVKYAAGRNITVVPEIEMPGHSQAAIAAYPQLGNTGEQGEVWTTWGVNPNILNVEESTIRFYQDVLIEVMELFPSPYIHVGGDEAPKGQWKASPRAQARIVELGLKDEDELQSWFIRRMGEFLASHGRKLVGWDEILEGGLGAGAMVMSWRGEEGGIAAANAGHDVIMAPQKKVYFDHYQSQNKDREPLAIGGFTSLEAVYEYEPVPAVLDDVRARRVQGSQAQLWTEYVADRAQAQYMIFPRLCALAEVVWSGRGKGEFVEFRERVRIHLERLRMLGIHFRPLDQ